MAYPGQDQNMSNYGAKEPSPEEVAGHWKQCVRQEKRIHKEHLATKGNNTDIWPGIRKQQEAIFAADNLSYYTKAKEHVHKPSFDRMFNIEQGYNSRLHRDDRQNSVGLDILSEEKNRRPPVLSSSEYGRRVHEPLEQSVRNYVRVERVMKGFYSNRGTGIPSRSD